MSVVDLIGWAVFGLVAGAIARFLHPGRDPMNWLWTMLLGVGGSLTGGTIARTMGVDASGGLLSWVAAVAGAILLLVLYYMATANREARTAGPAKREDYKKSVFDDLSRGSKG